MLIFNSDEEKRFWMDVYLMYLRTHDDGKANSAKFYADDAIEALRARTRYRN